MVRWSLIVGLGWLGLAALGACGGSGEGGAGTGGTGSGAGGPGGSSSDVLAACTRVSACFPAQSLLGLGALCSTFQAYTDSAAVDQGSEARLFGSLVECIAAASDCTAAQACVQASAAEAAVCPGTDTHHRCSGNTLVECTDDGTTPDAFDCAAAGLVCGQGDTMAECGTASCAVAQGEQWSCQGDLLLHCDTSAGVTRTEDCRHSVDLSCGATGCTSTVGGTCGDTGGGQLGCIGTGASCTSDTLATHCDGAVVVSCRNGKEEDADCNGFAAGYTCAVDGNGLYGCVAGTDCATTDDEGCVNGVVSCCIGGKPAAVDCTAYGYSGCTSASAGGQVLARCVP